MSKRLQCRLGHQWDPLADSASATLGAREHCPVCGGDGAEANGAAPEITLFARPKVAPDDSPPTLPGTEAGTGGLDTGPQELPVITGYDIIEELGRGGMGVVYKARQRGLNRIVALKMVLAGNHAGPKSLGRFRSEAEAVARLHHPNIVQIYEVGDQDGRPYFSLEYVDGGSLAKRLGGAPQSAHTSALLVETLARAIHVAHLRGIIHRDLKPANILLSSRESSDESREFASGSLTLDLRLSTLDSGLSTPKITDFGLAKQLESASALSHSGGVVGTPSYMAPEQAGGRGNEVGPTADVYSLGAILYELLTGRAPFRGETALDTMLQVLSEDPVPPSRLQPKVARDLETICLKCLEKEPRRRYPSALDLADELHRFLNHEPILARPISAAARGVRWCRRNPVLAGVGALAVVALLAVVGLSLGFGVLQARATKRLEIAKERTEHALREARETAEKLKIADTNRRRFERMSASLALDQGLRLCEKGDVNRGMLWLARSLEIAPKDAEDLQRAIRANVDRWSSHLHTLKNCVQHDKPVLAVAFSRDGRLAITGGEDRTARVWDLATGLPYRPQAQDQPLVIQHENFVMGAAFSVDGQMVATASSDRTARIWNVGTGKPVGAPLKHAAVVSAVAFSPDNRRVATACYDDTAQIWDIATGQRVGKRMEHQQPVTAIAFSPNGQTIVTGSFDQTAQLWDANSGERMDKVRYPPMQHADTVMAVAFSPDGKKIVTGGGRLTRAALVWDADTCKQIGKPLMHRDRVGAVAFGRNSTTVLTGSWDQTARLWNLESGEAIGIPLPHRGEVRSVAFCSDGLTLLTGCSDGTARLWNAALGTTKARLKLDAIVTGVGFTPEGTTILTGEYDNRVRFWDAETGQPRMPSLKHPFAVMSVALSPDGKLVATGTNDVWAQIWDARSGKFLHNLQHENAVPAVAFGPGNDKVVTGSWDKMARVWDARNGKLLVGPIKHDDKVTSVAFSPDGKTFATACEDKRVRFWETTTGKLVGKPLLHPEAVLAVAFSPDSKTVLTGCQDKMARLWNVANGNPVGLPLQHQGAVASVAFSPLGQIVLTGAEDNAARFWEIGTGKPIGPPLLHTDRVGAVAFSRDGKRVMTGSDDRTARVWDAPVLTEGGVGHMVLWAQLVTGMELDSDGIIHELNVDAWLRVRQRLQGGGTPTADPTEEE
ncbi:MAG: protein kinase [Gemmataceae bacterium]|nr:protein kinase [Gemmataceae bacterium]